jgi:hypothetical protein
MFTTNFIKQTVFGVMMALVAFSSCKKEKSEEPQAPAKPLQLVQFSDGDDVTKFEYNTDGSFKSITLKNDPISTDENVTYTAKYAASKKMEELNGSNGTKLKLTYANSLLSTMEAFAGTQKFAETIYEYNGAVMKSSTISLVDNNQSVPFFKGDFTFNTAGNITRSNVFVYNPLTNKLESTGYVINQFDNKVNPFIALSDVITIFWQVTTKNNITKQEYFDKDGKAEEVVETTYTYNAQGYPVRATMKETAPGQQPSTATVAYTYKEKP